ncbi:MAG: ATP-binding cassette domain-containing protein [Phycisphaerales bacterium]|nr:ATP-binding cassette domain-containing protein [Phycisphaerales bacterium]
MSDRPSPSAASGERVQLKEVFKTFGVGTANETHALDGVALEFAAGSFTVVIGTNGSGKSTLLSAIAGTFRADQGTIAIGATDVTSWVEHRRARFIGRVFQDPFAGTAPTLTVAENLALAESRGLARTLRPLLRRAQRDSWRERLVAIGLGLEDRLDDPIGLLSGGQRQSITLLMATMCAPAVLLLDEHTAALDPKSAEQVIELTQRAVDRYRPTTIMVTHAMSQAAMLGDRLIAMHSGRIYLDVSAQAKQGLQASDLHALFSQMRREDRLDEATTAMLRAQYS